MATLWSCASNQSIFTELTGRIERGRERLECSVCVRVCVQSGESYTVCPVYKHISCHILPLYMFTLLFNAMQRSDQGEEENDYGGQQLWLCTVLPVPGRMTCLC